MLKKAIYAKGGVATEERDLAKAGNFTNDGVCAKDSNIVQKGKSADKGDVHLPCQPATKVVGKHSHPNLQVGGLNNVSSSRKDLAPSDVRG